MGLSAELIAIGPFSQAVVSALEHPEERYRDVRAGSEVVTTLFSIGFSSGTWPLKEALGVSRSRSIPEVGIAVDTTRVDLGKLKDWCSGFGAPRTCSTVDSFITLRDAGFSFYLFIR